MLFPVVLCASAVLCALCVKLLLFRSCQPDFELPWRESDPSSLTLLRITSKAKALTMTRGA